MTFKELLVEAKAGNTAAKEEIYLMFRPGMINKAMVDGVFDEDLFQELCMKFLVCIDQFDMTRYMD